jgi:hypothetical protein
MTQVLPLMRAVVTLWAEARFLKKANSSGSSRFAMLLAP